MTGNSEQFSLRWNNFHSNITSEFQSLFQREDLVDVTLATDGKYIQAHKLVLSVCSPYFKELFKVNPCKHPIVILKDVSNKELTAILQFMYRGEVNVKQEELASFLKTAEMLQVKGLTGEDSPSSSPSHHEPLSRKVPITPNTVPMSEIPITESESPGIRPAKRSRTSTLHSSPAHSLPSVQSPSSIIIPVPSKSPSINSDNSRDVEFMDIRPKDEPLDYDEDFGEINVTPNIKSTSDHLMHILGGESSHSNQDTSAGSGMFSPISGLQDSNITQDGGQVQYTLSARGHRKLMYKGFIYTKKYDGIVQQWRCEIIGCNGKVWLSKNPDVVTKLTPHSHEPMLERWALAKQLQVL